MLYEYFFPFDNVVHDNQPDVEIKKDRNGEALVRPFHDGVFLKVTKPRGKGVTEKEASGGKWMEHKHLYRLAPDE